MKKFPFLIALVLSAAVGLGADEKKLPPMPAAVSGNAVASLKDGLQLFSLMGVGPRKTWDDDHKRIEYGSGPAVIRLTTVNGPVTVD